jgi:hypothetical protein
MLCSSMRCYSPYGNRTHVAGSQGYQVAGINYDIYFGDDFPDRDQKNKKK